MKIVKNVLNNARKAIVITITAVASIYLLLWILSLDSQTIDQLLKGGMTSCICGIWIATFLYANCEEKK